LQGEFKARESSMRIDFNYGPQNVSEGSLTTQPSPAAESSASLSGAMGMIEDQAQLSGAHVQVAALAAQASQLPEVREERVQALREAVTAGRYNTSADEVAGALMTHMIAGSAA
jgi:flagellar biosynthesis anti-sigma factor FlgM